MESASKKLQVLQTVLGTGYKTNRDYYQFICPFCNHHKPKLGVSLGTGKWKCWVCGVNGGKVTILLNKLSAPKKIITQAQSLFVESHATYTPKVSSKLTLPKEYLPLWKPSTDFYYKKALSYLIGRGVTHLDILKHRIGYCQSGRYSNMIIFPFYNLHNELIYFTSRSYNPNSVIRFINPINVEKDNVYDENLVNWSEPLVIVESKLDAIIVRRNALPLNGKQISKSLFKKIIEENVKVVYLCLDGDAVKDIMKYSEWFNQHGIDVFAVELPIDEESSTRENKIIYHDPTSLGHEKIWHYIDNSNKVSHFDNFKFKILSKLNR